MLNRYPLWKYLLILFILGIAAIYAAPNLYEPDPAIQITGQSSAMVIDGGILKIATDALEESDITHFGDVATGNGPALIRFGSLADQSKAKKVVQRALGENYVVALSQASNTPAWLEDIGAGPMKLGLDLSGGVHFLMEVDTPSAIAKRLEGITDDLKSQWREDRIRYEGRVTISDTNVVEAKFPDAEELSKAADVVRKAYPELLREDEKRDDGYYYLQLNMSEATIAEIEDYAVAQNLATLRNRVDELGVSEPLVQRQGRNRIVVELPGVQDTAEAKRIIGKTANLEFRLEADNNATASEREQFNYRSEADQRRGPAYLERKVIMGGDNVTDARVGFDPQSGLPQVNITLDGDGGEKINHATRYNIGRRMGVLFIEYRTVTNRTIDENGVEQLSYSQKVDRKIISLATIQAALGKQFRITGLDSPAEATELALLLRSGALAAPMYFVQESTIGPSLGAENIHLGMVSVQLGLGLVLLFMLFYYRVFGLAANVALAVNMLLIVAIMSIVGATLTLPGIAGIVLTVGMAVDANVLIFSRIREELKNGAPVQSAIHAGFERAFTTILDANLTTLIVAVILYGIGTGPVKGFAVTLAIGILTSMFSAIMVTRAIVNLMYGGRRVEKLWI
ncbi:protein translocase subunit SecD [Halioxenophilus sp. WMMB6]|uniref:protein translocase subunit SecD n=1 Tax=Halioxenophilus sp. WMMB6 TaxID=3073815 RepID=UPI00295F101B|nr:protein translocase subunit SecD [Halioxenophilus sp. WMMB6]